MDGIPVQAMSVDQFCFANNFGRDLFYAMLKKGEAPECLMVGKRRLISFEAAARWRAKREIAANTEATEATEVVAA
jgi:hypothetical protein